MPTQLVWLGVWGHQAPGHGHEGKLRMSLVPSRCEFLSEPAIVSSCVDLCPPPHSHTTHRHPHTTHTEKPVTPITESQRVLKEVKDQSQDDTAEWSDWTPL